jgi:hypothetical protein
MISDVISEYEAALQRLIENTSQRVPPGTKITNDAVALEAGRGKGSIKKKREGFDGLILKIKAAAAKQKQDNNVKPNKASEKLFKDLYHESLARELMLISQIDELNRSLATINNVSHITDRRH